VTFDGERRPICFYSEAMKPRDQVAFMDSWLLNNTGQKSEIGAPDRRQTCQRSLPA